MPFLDQKKKELKSLLKKYKDEVDRFIFSEYGERSKENKLSEAFFYALEGAGKRFRPAITLMVSDALNGSLSASYSALAVELFHTASLIADDLPSMDDDSLRRDKPTLHKVYGEDVAILTSYALIGEGYQCIFKNKEALKGQLLDLDERSFLALEQLAKNNGLSGAPCGQFFDLHPLSVNPENLDQVLYRKTAIFFETAFSLGWLFGGGDLTKVSQVNRAAFHFGMAFQIYDDFCDYKADLQKNKQVNYAVAFGPQRARESLYKHLDFCRSDLDKLGLYQTQFKEMLDFLGASV